MSEENAGSSGIVVVAVCCRGAAGDGKSIARDNNFTGSLHRAVSSRCERRRNNHVPGAEQVAGRDLAGVTDGEQRGERGITQHLHFVGAGNRLGLGNPYSGIIKDFHPGAVFYEIGIQALDGNRH